MKILLLLSVAVVASITGFSQSSKPSSKDPVPTSLRPATQSTTFEPRQSKKNRSRRAALSPEEEFAHRMQAVAKARRKQEEEMKKPQYSNPLYFGHKRKPKKHSPKKMRFCKECGIRH